MKIKKLILKICFYFGDVELILENNDEFKLEFAELSDFLIFNRSLLIRYFKNLIIKNIIIEINKHI